MQQCKCLYKLQTVPVPVRVAIVPLFLSFFFVYQPGASNKMTYYQFTIPFHYLLSRACDLCRGTADWFGVSGDNNSTQRWRRRSLQHCSHLYGGLKAQVMRDMQLRSQDNLSLTSTKTPPPLYLPPHHPSHHHSGMQRVGWGWEVGGYFHSVACLSSLCHCFAV